MNEQIQKAIAENGTNINFITTYLGKVNWAEVIEVGLEHQVLKARQRNSAKAYAQMFDKQREEQAKVVTLYQASRELLPRLVNCKWAEFEQALADKYPHLADELANKLQKPLAERNIVRSQDHYKNNFLRPFGYTTLQDRIIAS